jgi:predicted secreted protein
MRFTQLRRHRKLFQPCVAKSSQLTAPITVFFNNPPWYERTLYRADEFLASVGYIKGLPTISRPSYTPGSSQDRPPPPNKRLVRPAEKRGRSAAGR